MKPRIYEFAKIVKQENFRIGNFSQVDDFVFINAGEQTSVGMFVHIGSFCTVIGGGRFEIGDFAGLSAGCRIITGSDDFSGAALTNPTVPSEYTNAKKSFVKIGRHAILGTNVVVFPGVTIGEGAAVGAGCIVRKDLEPWTIYAGVDCKKIKTRPSDEMKRLEAKLLREKGLRC